MGTYSPALVWFNQTATVTACCLSCGWTADPATLPEVRLHAIGRGTHTVQVTAATVTHVARRITPEVKHVGA